MNNLYPPPYLVYSKYRLLTFAEQVKKMTQGELEVLRENVVVSNTPENAADWVEVMDRELKSRVLPPTGVDGHTDSDTKTGNG